MKKTSISTNGSDNRLSYLDNYEEISNFRKKRHAKNLKEYLLNERNGNEIVLSKTSRWVLFFLLFLVQILMNMDHGTVPAATEDIRRDLNIDDDILGIFGSLVFLGNIIGTIFFIYKVQLFLSRLLTDSIGSTCLFCLSF
jgi:hypothetical protein